MNGNEKSVTINGGTYQYTWDDEDRLVKLVTPGNITDTFTYNGLGLRVGKTDSTGTYAYVCDGTSPGADVLSDGYALYMRIFLKAPHGAPVVCVLYWKQPH